MELKMAPASPPPAPPREFRLDSAATSPFATAPSSPHGRPSTSPFSSPAAGPAGGPPFLTAPPSPNLFELLPPPATSPANNPFDQFHHFTSAPASPRRAAAIYAHFAAEEGSNGGGRDGDDEDEEEFQPRGSYATSVPFDWEERPGTPKAGIGGGGNAAVWDDDADFDFGTAASNAAVPEQELTAADELFEKGRIRPLKPLEPAEKGKIRPLKPPPGLLDGGSVASSPRSPMTPRGGGMWSPRRRSRVGSGFDFDPFAAALLEATKAPSPLGPLPSNKEANSASGSPPKKPAPRPASRSAGWRRWRLSDLLLFRSSSDVGRVNKDPVFKCSPPAQQPDAPVKKSFAQIAMPASKASGINGYDMMSIKAKKQGNNRSAAAAADGVAGCARLSPLQRLAKGIGAYSWHNGRGMAAVPELKR